jgi:hypothetical protein
MCGAISPLSHTSSWCGAKLSTGTTLALFFNTIYWKKLQLYNEKQLSLKMVKDNYVLNFSVHYIRDKQKVTL